MAIEIKTPRGQVVTVQTKDGETKAKLEWAPDFATGRTKGLQAGQVYVDSEVLRRSDPYVPFATGMLKRSGILGTVAGTGVVKYIAPYARQNYYTNSGRGKEGTQNGGQRGKYWFERMKADHKEEIRKKSGGKLK